MCYRIKDFLSKNDINSYVVKLKGVPVDRIAVSSKKDNILRFFDLLYQDADIFLERKYRKAVQIRNSLENNALNSGKVASPTLSETFYKGRAETIMGAPKSSDKVKG